MSDWTGGIQNDLAYIEERLAANLNVEIYTLPAEKPEDNCNEIWLPVERIG